MTVELILAAVGHAPKKSNYQAMCWISFKLSCAKNNVSRNPLMYNSIIFKQISSYGKALNRSMVFLQVFWAALNDGKSVELPFSLPKNEEVEQ